MAFLSGWQRRVKFTVPAANVSGLIPDFPVFVTRDCLPDEVCDPSGSNAAQADGGDLRVTLTDNTVLPLEIAAFGHDSSSGAGDAQVRLWFLAPSLSTSGDKEFYLYYNAETPQNQPAVTDPTGRNAVWSDFYRVYHLDEETGNFIDSTGSSADGVVSGTVTRGVAVGALKGVDFGATGHTNYIDAPSLGDQTTTFAVSCWVDLDATQGDWCGLVADGDDVGNGGIVVQREFNTNDLRVYYNGLEYYNDLTNAFSSIIGVGDTLLHVAVTPDSLINVYKNASNIATDSTQESSATAATTPTLKIGNARNGGNGIGGAIAELRIRNGALTTARMEAERDNQSLPTAFITTGTPESAASSGASVVLAGLSSSGGVGAFSASGSALLSLSGIQSASGVGGLDATSGALITLAPTVGTGASGDLSVTGGASLTISGVQSVTDSGVIAALGGASITASAVSATGQAGTIAVSVAGGVTVALSGVTATGISGDPVSLGGAFMALSGDAATALAGAIGATGSSGVTLSGVSAIGDTGTITLNAGDTVVTLSGIGATGQVGAISVSGGARVALSGVDATGGAGTTLAILDATGRLVGTITITPALSGSVTIN